MRVNLIICKLAIMFSSFFKLGVEHIFAYDGIDHILFLLVMVIAFSLKDWKKVILLATAFTIGHSITLILSSLGMVSTNPQLIEILIAGSITCTALLNLISVPKVETIKLRYVFALIFGIIHGLGFSNTIRSFMGIDEIVVPLLGVNLGVELAQIVVVLIVLFLGHVLCEYLKVKRSILVKLSSAFVLAWSVILIVERI